MTIGEWIGIGGVLLTAGGALARLASLSERVTALENSRDKMGERIGRVETEAAIARNELSRPIRG